MFASNWKKRYEGIILGICSYLSSLFCSNKELSNVKIKAA